MTADNKMLEPAAALLRERKIRFLELLFVDVIGTVKSVVVPVHNPAETLRRQVWVDGSSLEGGARLAETDMYLRPDAATLAVTPAGRDGAMPDTARVICDVLSPGGEGYPADPRQVLRRTIAAARARGLSYAVAPEIEFYLYRSDDGLPGEVQPDAAGYFDRGAAADAAVVDEIVTAARACGIDVAAVHHELSPGQYEIDLGLADALHVADAIVELKPLARAIAQRHGLYATFMPKPFVHLAGSGMHTHQVLRDDSGRNALAGSGVAGLSDLALHAVAGQLAHARGMCAILAPLANSYRRLIRGFEAPVHITWGRANPSALLRIAYGATGAEGEPSIELRCLDGGANPYLAFAAMLAAALDGIATQAAPPPAIEGEMQGPPVGHPDESGIAVLPVSMDEALQELEWAPVIRAALGPEVFDIFMAAKLLEWDEFRRQLTDWERARYRDV